MKLVQGLPFAERSKGMWGWSFTPSLAPVCIYFIHWDSDYDISGKSFILKNVVFQPPHLTAQKRNVAFRALETVHDITLRYSPPPAVGVPRVL